MAVRGWQKAWGAAALWAVCVVGLLTGWDRLVMHQAFSPAKLVLRLVVFAVAAALLTLLLRRARTKTRIRRQG